MGEVQRICAGLVESALARGVWVRDADGALLAHAGDASPASDEVQLHETRLANGATLSILYDPRASSLGLVRLRARKACDDLDKAFRRPVDDDGGSGAPAQVGRYKPPAP